MLTAARPMLAATPDDQVEIPFLRLFEPLLRQSRAQLQSRISVCTQSVSCAALTMLEHSLARTLSDICAETLALEFSLFRFRHGRFPKVSDPLSPKCALYDDFANKMVGDNFGRLFADYPALQNLPALCVEQWTTVNAELLERFLRDRPMLSEVFAAGRDPGSVIAIETGLSDRHDHGRSVAALSFESGLRLIYKPRDVHSELFYFSLVDWLNHNGAPLDFRTVRVLPRNAYGWVEFVEHRPCQNSFKAQQFYRRAGQLLFLLYILSAVDCHFDNIIASGEHPVLVDTEMLLQPLLIADTSSPAHSVLRTGLLPRTSETGNDLSGLGCTEDQSLPLLIPHWLHANTDAMALTLKNASLHPQSNVPLLQSAKLSPLDYVDSMIEGFRAMYLYMLGNRPRLLARDGPLSAMDHQKVRVLSRGTLEYYRALTHMLHPRRLRNATRLEVRFDHPPRFPFLDALEVNALERLDVPRFFVDASADLLAAPGSPNHFAPFAQSGRSRVLSLMEALHESQLEQQVKLIRAAWALSALSQLS